MTDEKYTIPLKLVVEECDKEKLKAQEEAGKEWAFPEQKKTFTQAGRGKKKGIFLIRLICTHLKPVQNYSNGELDVLVALTSIFYLQFW